MRPINLIPTEERRSASATRTGPVAYLLVGTLAVVLIGVVLMVLFSNQVNDHKGEVARLETEKTAALASASSLSPYIDFANVSEQRTQTVAELADSRFDWPRVIRQLSLVLPSDVYFTGVSASSGGASGSEEGGGIAPSLQITGCAHGQTAVAGFVNSLKEIDGVTRLQLGNSTLKQSESEGTAKEACAKSGMAQFVIRVVFDDAPSSPDSGGGEIAEPAPEGEGESSEGSSEEGEGSESSESSSEESSEGSTSQSAATSSPEATG